ncbi:hypothetical protein [Cellulomonas sp. NPDC089187]|uniref:hypothetical protein n=1 Tax=Cellulomonas sp. NPDC089187 TaxID=3154970 RepID=UPI00341779B4
MTEPEPVSGTVEELDAAVRAYSAAFFGADATTIYGMLSARCAASTDVSTMTGNLMAVQSIYGAGPELLTVDASVDGPVGRATYTYSEASLNVTDQPWVFEGGSWRYDEC